MRKLLTLILIVCITPASCFGAFFKKANDADGDTPKGYLGTLPDLTTEYEPSETNISTPIFDKTKEFNSANMVKPIPRDDPAFVNIILKKDKTSPYINELQEFIDMLEQIYDSIENKEPAQQFNAKVYYFNMSADYFKDKYENKPESYYATFKQIMKVSEDAKKVSKTRSEAEKYKRYFAYTDTGAEYSAGNIDMKLFDFKLTVEKTIDILKNAR